ncbi:hypothetical protein D3C71_2211130 [compost metagenome]
MIRLDRPLLAEGIGEMQVGGLFERRHEVQLDIGRDQAVVRADEGACLVGKRRRDALPE